MPRKPSILSKPSPDSTTTPNGPKTKPSPSASPDPAAVSRRSERKRKPREFADSTTSPGKLQWSDDDMAALLRAAVGFRDRTGSLPKNATMEQFFADLKGSIDPRITLKQVGRKFQRMKGRYAHLRGAELPVSPNVSQQERVVYDLWKAVWFNGENSGQVEDGGLMEEEEEDEEEEEEEAEAEKGEAERAEAQKAEAEKAEEGKKAEEEKAGKERDEFPFIRSEMAELLKENGGGSFGVAMEEGLKLIDIEKVRALEGRLQRQARSESRVLVKRLKLRKEVAELLVPSHENDA